MGEIKCLSREGDTKISWDTDNEDEIKNAQELFEKRVTKGKWAAFREKRIGGKGDRIYHFDPDAARIILVPPIAGGAELWERCWTCKRTREEARNDIKTLIGEDELGIEGKKHKVDMNQCQLADSRVCYGIVEKNIRYVLDQMENSDFVKIGNTVKIIDPKDEES